MLEVNEQWAIIFSWPAYLLYSTGSTECTVKCFCDRQRITLSFLISLPQIWCLHFTNTKYLHDKYIQQCITTLDIVYVWAKGKISSANIQKTFYDDCKSIDRLLMTFNVIKLFIMIIKTVTTVKQIPPMFENWNGLLDAHFTLTRSRWRHMLWIVCLWKKYFK